MPRKYPEGRGFSEQNLMSFNEAGADAPEIHVQYGAHVGGARASMRPGRMPRKYREGSSRVRSGREASMRPGRMPRKYMVNAGKADPDLLPLQ